MDYFTDDNEIIDFDEDENEELDILTVHDTIRELCTNAELPIEIKTIQKLASLLNSVEISEREQPLETLYKLDCSLGPTGFGYKLDVQSKPRTYSFYQLSKYDRILRPIKYVYMPFGMSSYPAAFSRDIAQNACAYVEMSMQNLLLSKGLAFKPKATLGNMLYQYHSEFEQKNFYLIDQLNKHVYGKTKHQFNISLPQKQLLTLSESLVTYLVCRVVGLELLHDGEILGDIVTLMKLARTQKGVVIGQTWYV